ncbi:MAG: substrate-binding domain-containing protein [Armatimonadetes bacterium]|nr:substrate-binding domain-containing protein [Armatimonadota bacterium]
MTRRTGMILAATALLLLQAILMGGCGKQTPQPGTAAVPAQPAKPATPATEATKTWKIGFAQTTLSEPWRVKMRDDMIAAAKEHADEVELITNQADNDDARQAANVEDLVTQGIDLLIISPHTAEGLTSVVEKVYDHGIPVITLDRNIASDKYTCFIGADNKKIGALAAKVLAEKLGGKGIVFEIQGTLGATATTDRHEGFIEAIKQWPDIKVIGGQSGDYAREPAQKLMEDALQANDRIDGVYAHNDEMALGAMLAAERAGRLKDITIVGIDGQEEAMDAVAQGKMYATIIYPNGSAQAIETALKILKGEEVPKKIELESILVTKDNANDPDIRAHAF